MLSASIPPASASSIAARSTRSLLKGVRRAGLASVCLAIEIHQRSAYSVRTTAHAGALDGEHDLASRVPFAQVSESIGCLAQLVASVDHRLDRSGLEELAHEREVVFLDLRQERDNRLAPADPFQPRSDDVFQRP